MHKEKASVTNEWLTKLKNQTKSERGKNKNAKATDKVTEMVLFPFGFISKGGVVVSKERKLSLGNNIIINFFSPKKTLHLVNQDSKAMARARCDFCFSSAGSVLLVPRAPRPAGWASQVRYLTVGSHHAAGIVGWRLCVRRGL